MLVNEVSAKAPARGKKEGEQNAASLRPSLRRDEAEQGRSSPKTGGKALKNYGSTSSLLIAPSVKQQPARPLPGSTRKQRERKAGIFARELLKEGRLKGIFRERAKTWVFSFDHLPNILLSSTLAPPPSPGRPMHLNSFQRELGRGGAHDMEAPTSYIFESPACVPFLNMHVVILAKREEGKGKGSEVEFLPKGGFCIYLTQTF